MEEWGTVIEVLKEEVKVKLESRSICKKCGICLIGEEGFRILVVEVDSSQKIKVGDKVEIQLLPGESILLPIFVVFIVPLIALFIGIFTGHLLSRWWGYSLLLSISFGLTFFLFSFLFAYWYDKKVQRKRSYKPRIIRIIRENKKGLTKGIPI